MLETLLFHVYLAQTATPDGGSGGIITVVYILTGISLIIGFAVGTYKYIQRQKQKWTDDGVQRERQAQVTADNTRQMMLNTEAVSKLTSEFANFALSVRQEMDAIGDRLGSLERWRNHSNGTG